MRYLADQSDVIRAVSDGGMALHAVTQLHPDVAVLDISMPILDGIEVARRMKNTGNKGAVIFLTCLTDPDIVDAACDVGSLGYVVKPRLLSDLVPAIRFALQRVHFVSTGIE